jgi:hypothetical protein
MRLFATPDLQHVILDLLTDFALPLLWRYFHHIDLVYLCGAFAFWRLLHQGLPQLCRPHKHTQPICTAKTLEYFQDIPNEMEPTIQRVFEGKSRTVFRRMCGDYRSNAVYSGHIHLSLSLSGFSGTLA